ncbi:response regulator transcription factor [Vibrio harveyi]|uniref:response regulator transcription factor n=1 Tax=Vibrio harveyi TaxID=669 RepID=UPI0023806A06|nr:response regulator transcription factor [Vibrio harveyi]EKO3864430.1 response regulator transcription factor [Vibrio harveyi]HDM8060254.1 response regulator transcription factor [Vibrio harveyi]
MNMGTRRNELESNILLIGENCIQNQFIRRELEKTPQNKLTRKSIHCLDEEINLSSYNVVLISNYLLEERSLSDYISLKTKNTDLVVYDVPKTGSDLRLFSCLNLKGVLYEDSPIEHLTRCIDAVLSGELWLPRKLMAKMLIHFRPYAISSQEISNTLTKREKQILDRIVQGQSNLEIADALFVAESTVKTHVYKLYKKLNVSCRKEAIQKFSRPLRQETQEH